MKEKLLDAAWAATTFVLIMAGFMYTRECELRIKELERMAAVKAADKKSETDDWDL